MERDYDDEGVKLLDTEVLGNILATGVRLVTSLDEQDFNELNVYGFRDFLATLDGVEFFSMNYNGNKAFGASFLYNDENREKIDKAGYVLRISFRRLYQEKNYCPLPSCFLAVDN